jgi:hypothetical protein
MKMPNELDIVGKKISKVILEAEPDPTCEYKFLDVFRTVIILEDGTRIIPAMCNDSLIMHAEHNGEKFEAPCCMGNDGVMTIMDSDNNIKFTRINTTKGFVMDFVHRQTQTDLKSICAHVGGGEDDIRKCISELIEEGMLAVKEDDEDLVVRVR